MKLGWKRLLKLADILDVADAEHRENGEPGYLQKRFAHECGSPACALGHYAANSRKRDWTIRPLYGSSGNQWAFVGNEAVGYRDAAVLKEFSISSNEAYELFSTLGCGSATTAKQASKYIRKFVKRKQSEAQS